MRSSRREGDRGFSVLVFLVGIVIVGLVVTVIVIGARSRTKAPTAAECDADRAALLRAEEQFRARQGAYGTEADLVEAGLLKRDSSLHDVTLGADSFRIVTSGSCAEASDTTVATTIVHLVFDSVPDTVTAGRVIDPAITVTLTDDAGAVVAGAAAEVTISLQATNGARLSGTTTVRAVEGVATFAGLAIDKAGSGYSFSAEAAGATGATSTHMTVTAGMVAKLRFDASPTTATPGVPFTTQPVVEVEDVMGNVIANATDPITLGMKENAGVRLTCDNLTVVPVGGVATFTGCQIDRAGTDLSLTATTATLETVSDAFAVIGPASKLAILQQPAQAVAGDTLSTISVAVEDSAGNVITDSNATVTVTVNKNAAALGGTTSVAVIDGVATFADLTITTSATEYTLTMKGDGLRSTTTVAFDVTTGPASQLVFTRQPSGGKAAKSWSTQPIVTVEDAFGNVVATSTDTITLQLTSGSGTATAALACAINPLAVANGEARFFKCSVDVAGDAYTLTATSGALSAVSAPFSIT